MTVCTTKERLAEAVERIKKSALAHLRSTHDERISMATALIGFGSNLGNRVDFCDRARHPPRAVAAFTA